jgi:hypothetical protein
MNKREMLVEFVAALAIAAISMLTVYSLAYAQHAVETGTGVVCDTSEQVTRLLKADDFQATLVAVNTEQRNSCAVLPIAFIVHGETGEQARIHGATFRVTQILVLGLDTAEGMRPIKPTIQWTALFVEERGA